MIRRRPFRRRPLFRRGPLPPPGARPPLPPRQRRALARANGLLAHGQFVQAADIFEKLSQEAKRRGMLVRAADLALQASRAYFSADDAEAALDRATEAVRLLVRGGRAERVDRVVSRMTAALRQKGWSVQADQLEREAAQALAEVGLSLYEPRQRIPQVAEARGSLPAQCSGCGAQLIPDEVEWHDAHTAECLYCGTIVKAT